LLRKAGGGWTEKTVIKSYQLLAVSYLFTSPRCPQWFQGIFLFPVNNLTQKSLKATVYYNKNSIKRMLKAAYKRPDMKDKTKVFEKQAVPL
jgi:hypothetical protein